MRLANRYMELILHLQTKYDRDLNIDELEKVKGVVAKEMQENMELSEEQLWNILSTN